MFSFYSVIIPVRFGYNPYLSEEQYFIVYASRVVDDLRTTAPIFAGFHLGAYVFAETRERYNLFFIVKM